MLRPRLFSLAGECADDSFRLRRYIDDPVYLHIDYRLMCRIRKITLVSGIVNVVKNHLHG
jgi:hypothetical protein